MRIVVFGATGNVGGHLARRACEKGHEITAVVRDPARYEAPAGARVEVGDVLDAAFAARVIAGHDVVVSGLGMRYAHPWAKRRSPDDFVSRATAGLIAGARAAGVKRLQIVSAAGVGSSRAVMNFAMQVMLKLSNVGVAYADLDRTEALLAASELDWQAVRPVTLTHGPASQKAHVVASYGTFTTIPRDEVARYMLGELERPAFSERTPMIAG
ncbi:MAG: NAD(P)H-binding protein [Sandaracinus sp.]